MDESGDKIYLSSSLFGNHKKPQVTLSAVGPVRLHKIKIGKNSGENDNKNEKKSPGCRTAVWSVSKEKTTESIRSMHNSHAHSKKGMKHALRQQAKRRRKNTTIAAGNLAPLPRFVTPTSVDVVEDDDNRSKQPTTMNDILTSIPGFCIKHRKRTNKKLSTAAQLEQTKEGCIDLETPDSILVQTNLRDLLNEQAFLSLPPLYQYKLVQLLPPVDRIAVGSPSDCVFKLSPSGLNNEFFKSACSEWKDRLTEGEFTPENQQKRKLEAERERNKLDPWKIKHFEPIWGESLNTTSTSGSSSDKDSISPKSIGSKSCSKSSSPTLKNRTVGAVTRSVSMYREKREAEDGGCDTNKKFKPAFNPSTNYLTQFNMEGKGINMYDKRHRFDKPLEIKIVESRQEHRDRQEIPLIKAVQFEPDLSMCSVLGMKSPVVENNSSQDITDCGTSKDEETVIMNIESNAAVNVFNTTSITSNSTSISTTSSSLVDIGFTNSVADNVSSEKNNDVDIKNYENVDSVEEIIITAEREENENMESELMKNESDAESEVEESYNRGTEVQGGQHEEGKEKHEGKQGEEDKEEREKKETEQLCIVEEIAEEESTGAENIFQDQVSCEETETDQTALENNENEVTECSAIQRTEEDDALLEESVNIEKIINEEAENWSDGKDDQVQAAIFAAAWSAVDGNSDKLLAEVNLSDDVFGEDSNIETDELKKDDTTEHTEKNSPMEAPNNEAENVEENIEPNQVTNNEVPSEENTSETILSTDSSISQQTEDVTPELEKKEEKLEKGQEKSTMLEVPISIDRIINEGDENWDNSKEEQVQAAILAAAWNAVHSSTEKLLTEAVLERETEVAVIPMQEELEVKLEESSSPAPEWASGFRNKAGDVMSVDSKHKSSSKMAYPSGHVKLELEVTLTPEVDSQVTSTGDNGGSASDKAKVTTTPIVPPNTVIPPTTIVCLPTTNSSVPPPLTTQIVTNQAVSSSALPYIALTTSTPVRAVPTKTQAKSGGRGGRNSSNKPPPGAVNLERSYQICQAVIQNSPNRDQLKFQLKPPPSMLLANKDYTKPQTSTNRGGISKTAKSYNSQPTQNPMLVKHVFTSTQGIPVTMAVLPPSNTELTESQMGQYVLVQRSGLGSGIRRSNSAPPANQKSGTYGIGGCGRPASVGMQQHQQHPGTQPVMRTIVANPNGPAYYSVPQQYSLVTRVNNDCTGCSRKAMVMCKKCGAFCHDDCIEPYKMCVNCR